MHSFEICAIVVLSFLSSKAAAKDPTLEDKETLENNVKDAQTKGYLDKILTNLEVESIIKNLFKVADVKDKWSITSTELFDALKEIPEITCNEETARALIDAVDEALNTPTFMWFGTLSKRHAELYVEAVTGKDRMIRLREILTGEINKPNITNR